MLKAILGYEVTASSAESKNELLAARQAGGNNAELPNIFRSVIQSEDSRVVEWGEMSQEKSGLESLRWI